MNKEGKYLKLRKGYSRMLKKCKCGKEAVVIKPNGKNACVDCYNIYIKKEKYYGRQTST